MELFTMLSSSSCAPTQRRNGVLETVSPKNQGHVTSLPIRRLDLAKPDEKAQHDRIVALVEEMLALQQRRHPVTPFTAADREELDRRIAQQDRAIDDAVYGLYGLTADERRIVEEAVPAPEASAPAGRPRRRARTS